MSLTSMLTVAAESGHESEAAVSPYVVGAVALGILLVMLVALLMFGKGREHS